MKAGVAGTGSSHAMIMKLKKSMEHNGYQQARIMEPNWKIMTKISKF